MLGRITLLAPAALLIIAGTSPQSPPPTTTYRIENKINQVISVPGQPEQTTSVTQIALVTVSLQDSAGGRTMHVIVDSVESPGTMSSPEAIAALKGAWVHAFLDPSNRASNLRTSNDSSDALALLKSTLATFYPRIKPGHKEGDQWVDTTDVESRSARQASTTRTITSYAAGADEIVNGAPAERLSASFTANTTGTIQNPMAGSMDLEAVERGTSVQFVGRDGRYLGGRASATGDATVRMAMMPDPIPVKTTRTTTVSVVE